MEESEGESERERERERERDQYWWQTNSFSIGKSLFSSDNRLIVITVFVAAMVAKPWGLSFWWHHFNKSWPHFYK